MARPSSNRLERCGGGRQNLTGSRSANATMASSSEIDPRNTLSGAKARCTIFPQRPRADRTAARGVTFENCRELACALAEAPARRARSAGRTPLTHKVGDLGALHSAHEPHLGTACALGAPGRARECAGIGILVHARISRDRAAGLCTNSMRRRFPPPEGALGPQLQDRQAVPEKGTRGFTTMAGRGRCERQLWPGMARGQHRSCPRWRAAAQARRRHLPMRPGAEAESSGMQRAVVCDLPLPPP